MNIFLDLGKIMEGMSTDLSFITNQQGQTLLERFKVLIQDARFFDCLVGYFYTSGFYRLYPSLERTEKIRILIGIATNKMTYDLIQGHHTTLENILLSHTETRERYQETVAEEFENSDDTPDVEAGVVKFMEWIKSNKLEIRAYPAQNIHAKLYIMTFFEGDRDIGRVITGSSNFTEAGLKDNLEFNVELKNRSDYEYAKQKFEELWNNAVEVSKDFIQTIENKTWLNQNITPYELYLKFLYEYYKNELSQPEDIFLQYLPRNFLKLEYQEQAVLNAKRILEEYGGVFISDVVGVGKTYICAMLASQLDGRTLVIAPPALLERNNPNSWPNVFSDFRVPADFESIGKLEELVKMDVEKYKNVIVDEAHRFRTETTLSYEYLAEICRGKRVILVTATPYNNTPRDILSQIKLFQNVRRSTIPNLPDIEGFISKLEKNLKGIDRQKEYDTYMKIVRKNAVEIRDKLLKYLMVRRTRSEIMKYFASDLQQQNIRFPDAEAPCPLFYQFNDTENQIFDETIRAITTRMNYARYTPMLYYKKDINQPTRLSQENMGKLMKILLVKRLESSFIAFSKSVDRFIESYRLYIESYHRGTIYISQRYSARIFELMENDDDVAIQKLIDEGKAEAYHASDFNDKFIGDLNHDLDTLMQIKNNWQKVTRDPKIEKFLYELEHNPILKKNKLVVFTESKETAEYLAASINKKFNGQALLFTGSSSENIREKVIENFDARARYPKDDYRILIATDVLSEGVNLHRSNVVINYDIPWNPTRMMQRVGRVNRVGTDFEKIYTFNFFPTIQANEEIKLKEAAEAKIHAFLTLLGGDAALLTEGEPIGSHELFNRLISKNSITGEDDSADSELKYLTHIKEIRDTNPELFNKIKRLPKKARSSKTDPHYHDHLITYFKRGKLSKFFLSNLHDAPVELDFITAASILECSPDTIKQELPDKIYPLLEKNKQAFYVATPDEIWTSQRRGGRDNAAELAKIVKVTLKNAQSNLTEDQENYLKTLLTRLNEGAIPKQTTKETMKKLDELKNEIANPQKLIAVLKLTIPERFLQTHYAEAAENPASRREVILSLYLTK